jgi:hypothetical protein
MARWEGETMADLTRDEVCTISGTARSLESLAEDILAAGNAAEGIDECGADTLARIVRLLDNAEGSLRWLRSDLDRINYAADGRGELCDECENPVDECECAENSLDRLEDGE